MCLNHALEAHVTLINQSICVSAAPGPTSTQGVEAHEECAAGKRETQKQKETR